MRPADNIPVSSYDGLSGELVSHDAGATVAHHEHGLGQLSLVLTGTMALSSGRGWWLAPPGRGIWVPPGIGHSVRYAEASSHIKILIDAESAIGLSGDCQTLSVSALLRELAHEVVATRPTGPSKRSALISELLVLEAARPSAGRDLFVPQGNDPRLIRAIQCMRERPGRADTLEDLAKIASCSARTLARLFIAETGMSFTRWREHLRIVTAVDYLIRGRSITHTALDLGYQSPSSFTTMFTRILGMPPGKYLGATKRAP